MHTVADLFHPRIQRNFSFHYRLNRLKIMFYLTFKHLNTYKFTTHGVL